MYTIIITYQNILNPRIRSKTMNTFLPLPKPSVAAHIPASHGGIHSVDTSNCHVIDFSSNINPLGTPKSVTKAIQNNIHSIMNYPDEDPSALLDVLARYTGVPADNLVLGNGAVEIIYNFCHAFLTSKTHTLIPSPTFSEYESASSLYGASVSYFNTMNLSDSIDEFLSNIPVGGCVFLCNPNNPTGELLSKKNVLSIVKHAEQSSSLVFLDECFIEMAGSGESVIEYTLKHENLLILRSLTKSFAMPGIRIGYASASTDIIKVLRRIRIPWSINSLALVAAQAAVAVPSHIGKSQNVIKHESLYLKQSISKLKNFECLDSSANFILIKTTHNSSILQKALLSKGILVRDCKSFRGLDSHYIRIAIRSHADNQKLILALESM